MNLGWSDWDVDRLARGPRARVHHPALAQPVQLVDAMSLALSLDTALGLAELADIVLGACRCLAGALLSAVAPVA
jgi:hypothetical protein